MTHHQARILLAEDNITNQQATLAVLENLGIRADVVANGQEAIAALQATTYDLVLMDCQMPVLNGYEATRLIRNGRSQVHDPQVPVIALTASTDLTERARCLECGMDDFLAKPVLPQNLCMILVKWLPTDRAWKQDEALPTFSPQPGQEVANPGPIWDRQGMLARLMGDAGVAQTIIEGFLVDLPSQMQALQTSLLQGDILAIMRQAHTIRGAAAIVGGQRLQTTALAVEQSAPRGDLPTLHALLEALQLEYAILQQKLQQTPLIQQEETQHDHGTTGAPSL